LLMNMEKLGLAIVASLNAPFGETGYGVLRL
jgi:hypothetical protein